MDRRQFLTGAGAGGACAAATATAGPADAALVREPRQMPEGALGMLVDVTQCIGCQACVAACREENGVEVRDTPYELAGWNAANTSAVALNLDGTTYNVIQLWRDGTAEVKDRETDGFGFSKRHCLHCIDPSCVSVCPVTAMIKDPVTGVVTYEADVCIGCRYCSFGCPFGVPQFDLDVPFGKINKCEMCRDRLPQGLTPACCDVCPTGASLFGPVVELQAEAERRLAAEPGSLYSFPRGDIRGDRSTHEAPLATYQRHVYGETEVGGTQVRYLSAVPFERLGLPKYGSFAPTRLTEGIQHTIYQWLIAPIVALVGVSFLVRRNRLRAEARQEREG